ATNLVYSGNNLIEIDSLRAGVVSPFIRTRYTYDLQNRLSSVVVDLTPDDGLVADGNTFVTSYTYDGDSKRIASVTRGDGETVFFTYDASGRVRAYVEGGNPAVTLQYTDATTTQNVAVPVNASALSNTLSVPTTTAYSLNPSALTGASAGWATAAAPSG